jgi:hypothetical protein
MWRCNRALDKCGTIHVDRVLAAHFSFREEKLQNYLIASVRRAYQPSQPDFSRKLLPVLVRREKKAAP